MTCISLLVICLFQFFANLLVFLQPLCHFMMLKQCFRGKDKGVMIGKWLILALTFSWIIVLATSPVAALVLTQSRSSSFVGQGKVSVLWEDSGLVPTTVSRPLFLSRCNLVMRKQKASDKRTRRQQSSGRETEERATLTQSPMQRRGRWSEKGTTITPPVSSPSSASSGGRGRSRKRSLLYNALSFYHDKFMRLLTEEYKAEV